MRLRLTAAVALALALGGVTAAPAQAPAAPIPPPQAPINADSVAAWVERHIETEGWRLMAADLVAASFGAAQGAELRPDGYVAAEVRREYYGVDRLGPNGTRSGRQLWIIDCPGRKVWVRRIAIYADNNLKGAAQVRETPEPAWTELSADSVNARLMADFCAQAQRAAPPEAPPPQAAPPQKDGA